MLLTPLQTMLNRNLAESAAARAACMRLQGKTLAVHVAGAPQNVLLSVFFTCYNDRMSIATSSNAPIAAALTGTPLAYLGMLRGKAETALRSGTVRIEGDAEVAQSFQALLKAVRPDVEEELSRVIGDVAAHQLGNFARGAVAFGERLAGTFAQNVAEFLQEESRDVVTRIEVDEFIESVDKLRDGVERIEAKLGLLTQSMSARQ